MVVTFKYITLNDGTLLVGDNTTNDCNAFEKGISIPSQLDININGKTITEIGQYAFHSCNAKITKITFPPTLREIHFFAFDNCKLEFETLDLSNIVHLHSYAFSSNKIKEIRIGNNMKQIDPGPFPTISTLEKIVVDPDNPYYSNDFQYCLFNKKQSLLIEVPMAKEKIIIPESVTKIGLKAFEMSKITEIVIPSNCKTLSMYSFRNCLNLKTIYIYSPLTYCQTKCFTNLQSIQTVYYLNNLNNKVNVELFYECPTSFTIITCSAYQQTTFGGIQVNRRDLHCNIPNFHSCMFNDKSRKIVFPINVLFILIC